MCDVASTIRARGHVLEQDLHFRTVVVFAFFAVFAEGCMVEEEETISLVLDVDIVTQVGPGDAS